MNSPMEGGERVEPTQVPDPLRLHGTVLGRYAVEVLIGRGGMAYVYRAQDLQLGRTVAVKVLASDILQSQGFRQRFLRESQLAASLDHPNIIPIYEAGESDDRLYIVMRYVAGSDLKAMLAGRTLDAHQAIDIFVQVADALDAAHASGLVHRDVKPANILVSGDEDRKGHRHVYLSDFGLTKRSSSLSGATAEGVVIGTMDYVAPEQIGGKPVDSRTDVYALGCVVYQALTGTLPFVRDDDAALLWAHLVEAPRPITAQRPDLPAGVDEIVMKAMAKVPDDRFSTCGEFITALAEQLMAADFPPDRGSSDSRGSQHRSDGPRIDPAYVRSRAAGWDSRTDSRPSGMGESPESAEFEQAGHQQSQRRQAGQPAEELTSIRARPARSSSLGATSPRRPRRAARGVIAVAVVAGLAALMTLFYFLRLSPAPPTHFAADNRVPFSFDAPEGWVKAGESITVVFSPRANESLPVFEPVAGADNWAAIRPLLANDPQNTLGLYTSFLTTQYQGATTAELEDILTRLLPAPVSITDSTAGLSVDDQEAVRFDGALTDPTGTPASLSFECYLVQRPAGEARTVLLLFFSSPEAVSKSREVSTEILQSVEFAP